MELYIDVTCKCVVYWATVRENETVLQFVHVIYGRATTKIFTHLSTGYQNPISIISIIISVVLVQNIKLNRFWRGPKRAQTGLKLKIVLRAGPGREKKLRAGPKNLVVLPSLIWFINIKYGTHLFYNKRMVLNCQYKAQSFILKDIRSLIIIFIIYLIV